MKQFNYIFSAIGWLGMIICLVVILVTNKCGDSNLTPATIEKQTIINNYYDSGVKVVPQIKVLPGEVIPVPVPQNVDTQKILEAYFAKYPYVRFFENDTIRVRLEDSISQNKFLSPGKFSYQWLKPIKTETSTTITVTNEAKKRINILAGGHTNFQKAFFYDWGPDLYLKTKRENLFGIGYDVRTEAYSIKAAVNLNEAFRIKNK
jgi:hypothetical protein